MIIEKSTIEKILAFTLAEVLITMMVIVLMTLASIPVIKNSKEFRETAKDKNYWMAYYDKNNQLRVSTDIGECNGDCPSMVEGDIAKFYPPEGVTRFNVTVVGAGGGGAAGMASGGQSKVFFPESPDQSFVPAHEGIYQIIAIGGGGGGGGGAVACDGGGGYSGGAVVAKAKLSPNEVYTVVAGPGGAGGRPQKPLSVILDIFAPVLWIGSIAAGVFTGGATIAILGATISVGAVTATASQLAGTVAAIISGNQPDDRMDGGGYGINSAFHGINADGEEVRIVACGGGGGKHVRKKAVWKCKQTGGNSGSNGCADYKTSEVNVGLGGSFFKKEEQQNVATGIVGEAVEQMPWKDGSDKKKPNGYICRMNDDTKSLECRGDVGSKLPALLKDIVPSQFGAGGRGGNYRKTGVAGQGGLVVVEEVAVYGGGGGQAGAVSFYSYTKSPLEGDEEYVEVVPGKGGTGGVYNGQEGSDGMFSRFGNRIIADGGLGGDPRATGADNSDESSGNDQAEGEDGIASAIPTNLLKKARDIVSANLEGAELIEQATGGIKHENGACKLAGLGSGGSSVDTSKEGDDKGAARCANLVGLPGMGGGGGGAESDGVPGGARSFGQGGNGASGIVMVTW